MDNRDLPQIPIKVNESNTSQEYKIEPREVHNAFVNLINYYHERDFGNLVGDADLDARENAINLFFPEEVKKHISTLLPYATSVEALRRISDSNNSGSTRVAREAITSIGGVINSFILPTDSCGVSANETLVEFLLMKQQVFF